MVKRVSSLTASLQKKRKRPVADEDEDRPLTAKEQREMEEADRNLVAATHLLVGLRRIDQARAALNAASQELDELIGSIGMPDVVREDFERFWKAGGATGEQYSDWLKEKRPKEPVPQRAHLRVVFSQKHRTSRVQLWWRGLKARRTTEPNGDPPEAA
jgi:hypothetical protein